MKVKLHCGKPGVDKAGNRFDIQSLGAISLSTREGDEPRVLQPKDGIYTIDRADKAALESAASPFRIEMIEADPKEVEAKEAPKSRKKKSEDE